MKHYEINVRLTPETVDGKPMYFYCVLVNGTNSGMCGWSETPEKAFAAAYKDYNYFVVGGIL